MEGEGCGRIAAVTEAAWTVTADAYRIALQDNGVLHARVMTVWSAKDVARFFDDLLPIHAEARRRLGHVLALVEVGKVLSPLVALNVRDRALAIKRPGDRTAMIVSTMLSKLQVARLAGGPTFGLFADRVDALAWLQA